MKTSHASAILLAAISMGLGISARSAAAEPSAEITEYGRYTVEGTALTPTTNKTSGSVVVSHDKEVLAETTDKIPCRLGETFGIKVKFNDLPADRPFAIKYVVKHPPINQPDGQILRESVVSDRKFEPGTKSGGLYFWSFVKGFEYELSPGDWTFLLYVDGKEVARFVFHVLA